MGYIPKDDLKLVTFMNRKYAKYKVNFETFDDYIMWLYYIYCRSNEEFYYKKMENDVMDYSNVQTGTPREIEKARDWKAIEKDKYGLYQNEKYVDYMRKMVWKIGKS